MAYSSSQFTTLHLELTTRCNAGCPMCGRSPGGVLNPNLPMAELSLEDVKAILRPSFLQQLGLTFICGNYGDPCAAQQTPEILSYLNSSAPNMALGIHTNGGARKPDWWAQIGQILTRDGDYCVFSIDGLADTNHLYRRHTQFERIMENAAAFIAAGGRARWEFLTFRHNEHQVEEARSLASAMGFERFTIKRSSRFLKKGIAFSQPVEDKNGNVIDHISPALDPRYAPTQVASQAEAIIARYGSFDAYAEQTPISCKSWKTLFVSAEGLVLPCCWFGNLYPHDIPARTTHIWRLIDSLGGPSILDGRLQTIREIVEGPFFKAVEDGWSKTSFAEGRLYKCAQQCGAEFDPIKSQYQ